MSIKRWVFSELNKERASKISEDLNIPFFLAMMLDIRGITSEDYIKSFLSCDTEISDPMLLADMDKAVNRINKAIDSFEKICVYGDYDADGVTSTALMYSYLDSCGANVMYYIPRREDEGYGLSIKAIERLHKDDVDLIITVDNGIVSIEEVDFANNLGIDVIITDHHQTRDTLPNAVAVIDPHREDCNSKFKDLAGVGVAFMLITALEGEDPDIDRLIENYSDLVSIGTIGDIVPLVHENRFFVKEGLKNIQYTDRIGLKSLLEEAGIYGKGISAGNVAFTIVPRINAMGRLDSANKAVKLLISDSYDESCDMASELGERNSERQRIETIIQREAEQMLDSHPTMKYDRILVIDGEKWHNGVVGIVASRITEKYSKPCIVISRDGDEAKGSGRSVSGFSLYDAIFSCSDLLTKFGGHPMAAGLNMKSCDINELRNRVNDYAKKLNVTPYSTLKIDCKLNPEVLSVDLINQLSVLEPFGSSNPKPVFALCKMVIEEICPVGGGKHLRLNLSRNNKKLKAMKFSTGLQEFLYKCGDIIDIAVSIDKSEYRGIEDLSIIIKDIKLSDIDLDEFVSQKSLYEKIRRNEETSQEEIKKVRPNRDEVAKVYIFLRKNNGWSSSIDILNYRLNDENICYAKTIIIIDIMNELGLIEVNDTGDIYNISMVDINKKVDLNSSEILSKLQ